MTTDDFDNLIFFKATEFDNPALMNVELLTKLDCLREYIGSTIFVSSSTGGTHREGSEHYLGNAVDVLFPNTTLSLLSLFLIIERFNFTGVGLYPDWHYGGKVIGGFHLDMRELNETTGLYGKRWIGKKEFRSDIEAKTYYHPLNPKKLIEFNICTMPKTRD